MTIDLDPMVVCAGCEGGQGIEQPTAEGHPAGGTYEWSCSDASMATAEGAGEHATVRGVSPGVTAVNVTYTVQGYTCDTSVSITAVEVQLDLRNAGTVTAQAENTAHDEVVAAMGTDQLGELPMGDGRADAPGRAYTAGVEVVATVSPPSADSLTYRWKRDISRRSWNIRHDAANAVWNVTQRSRRGFPDDDTGSANHRTETPNVNHRMYSNDGTALAPGNDPADLVGDFIHERKAFVYRVERDWRGGWVVCAELAVGQIITVERVDTTGTTATDWSGVENSIEERQIQPTIDEATVRGFVGGADPIHIDANANH